MLLELFLGFLPALPTLPAYVCCGLLLFASGAGAGIGQDALLLALAAATVQGTLHVGPLAAVAFVSILAGDATSLWVGRHYGARWVRRPWAEKWVPPQRLPAMEAWMRRHGALFAFVTRFLPGQRAALFFIGGSFRLPWRSFAGGDAVAALLQVPLYVYGVRALGWDWQRLRGPIDTVDNVLTGAVLLALAFALLVERGRRRRGRSVER